MKRTGARLAATILVIPLAAAGCGSSNKTASGSGGGSGVTATTAGAGGAYGSDASATTVATSANTVAAGGGTGGATVRIATLPKLGKVLVAADGRTLYLFEKDKGTTSACTGTCAQGWPAYTSSSAPTAGAGLSMKLTTATGAMANQVVYNGHLLYEFAGDSKAGDAHGVGIPSWYAVTPAGGSDEAAG